jgi:hypothetical protein
MSLLPALKELQPTTRQQSLQPPMPCSEASAGKGLLRPHAVCLCRCMSSMRPAPEPDTPCQLPVKPSRQGNALSPCRCGPERCRAGEPALLPGLPMRAVFADLCAMYVLSALPVIATQHALAGGCSNRCACLRVHRWRCRQHSSCNLPQWRQRRSCRGRCCAAAARSCHCRASGACSRQTFLTVYASAASSTACRFRPISGCTR